MPSVSRAVWYSQLFENTFDGGALLALPFEGIAPWKGGGEQYEEMIGEIDQFLCLPLGPTLGIFISDDDGVHEAHWMRWEGQAGMILVVWSAWDDPARRTLPDNPKKVARAWELHQDPRQSWLEHRLQQKDVAWQKQDGMMCLKSGLLFLLHAESNPRKARLPKPGTIAKCGEYIPVGTAPGEYQIERTVINELPDGPHFCLLCRWSPAVGQAGVH